jgi:hypothetical protein
VTRTSVPLAPCTLGAAAEGSTARHDPDEDDDHQNQAKDNFLCDDFAANSSRAPLVVQIGRGPRNIPTAIAMIASRAKYLVGSARTSSPRLPCDRVEEIGPGE